jgi:hypothetical protein
MTEEISEEISEGASKMGINYHCLRSFSFFLFIKSCGWFTAEQKRGVLQRA